MLSSRKPFASVSKRHLLMIAVSPVRDVNSGNNALALALGPEA